MRINNNHVFNRELEILHLKTSAFLFGPRMTGKTSLLSDTKYDLYFDLLDPTIELKYLAQPQLFWEQLQALPKQKTIVVDEVQRVPKLLDYVQMGIERLGHRFLLSGSSARKLKRGAANLLGGRALDLKLHPLTLKELDGSLNIHEVLSFGTLPKIASLVCAGDSATAEDLLSSYVTTYLKEEIQAEAIVRRLDSFQRFLAVAAQSNAQMIEYSNISRECAVHMNTVKGFYEVLEDTLIGSFLWPLNRSERKKSRPKFYFFDTGVIRALQGRLDSKPSQQEIGLLFESWFINEVRRVNDYLKKGWQFSLWRKDRWEIDLLISKGSKILIAIELKTSQQVGNLPSIEAFRKSFPRTELIVASLVDHQSRKLSESKVEILPYEKVLEKLRNL